MAGVGMSDDRVEIGIELASWFAANSGLEPMSLLGRVLLWVRSCLTLGMCGQEEEMRGGVALCSTICKLLMIQ